jgi:multiple sugar transport system permease protein
VLDPSPTVKAIFYVLMIGWSLVVLFPLYWVAVTSLKVPVQVNAGPVYLPGVDFEPSLHAWEYVVVGDLANSTIPPFINTVVVALSSALIALVLGSAAAYALTRFHYRPRVGSVMLFLGCLVLMVVLVVVGLPWQLALAVGLAVFLILRQALVRRFKRSLKNRDVAFWMISQRMLPPVAVVLPIYILFQNLGLLDTRISLIVAYVATNLPIVVWLMRDYFQSIPTELEESAAIDGASIFRTFHRVVLPVSVPGLVATFLFVLVFAWNEFLLALFLSGANSQTLPLTIAAQNATRGPQWWYMSVLILIMIIPVIIMAIALERFISRGLMVGAVKG